MGQIRIANDAAWECAGALMDALRGVFRPEELKDAHTVIHEHIKAAIETAFQMWNRELQRLCPSRN